MYRLAASVLLISSIAFAQTQNSSTPQPESKAPSSITLPAPNKSDAKPASVPESAPVITLNGLCPGNTGPATGPDCKKVVTRAEFEKLVGTLNPDMPQNNRGMLASQYAKALVLAGIADHEGIAETQHFKDMMAYMRTQILATEVVNQAREKAKPTAGEVDSYYKQHQQDYEQAAFKRLYIPKSGPSLKAGEKAPTEAELKAEADRIRARAVAGEDFDKIEKEIYSKAGIKTPPPPTSIPNWRRNMIPPAQASIFDMKTGEVSQPIVQPEGIYIYKLESKKTIPLSEVRAQIESQLESEKLRTNLEGVLAKVKPELNDAYFGTPTGVPSAEASTPSRSAAHK